MVLGEGGSRRIRDTVLRRLLEVERAAQAEAQTTWADHTLANYTFAPAGVGPDGLFRMRATPRRRDPRLIDGTFFLLPADAELVRIEGRLARGPSFWAPRVEVVRRYSRVAGRRVPLRHESVAHMRLFGDSRLSIKYHYEMVDGRDLEATPSGHTVASRALAFGRATPP